MSRARQSTHVWTVADDLPQAVDDLRRDWSTRRTPTWAIDTGQPAPQRPETNKPRPQPEVTQVWTVALAKARTDIAQAAFVTVRPLDCDQAIDEARSELQRAHTAKADLAKAPAPTMTAKRAGPSGFRHARSAGERALLRRDAQHAPRWRDRRDSRQTRHHVVGT